jgi:glycosyltransferase involved in cell wall biosynthesis
MSVRPRVKMRLIVVGPVPPPYHGVSVSTDLILGNRTLRERFTVEHLDTSDHRSGANIGRWEVRNVLGALGTAMRVRRQLAGTRGMVYLPISQGLPGLTRDAVIIHLAARRGWKVAAHLRGGELTSVYNRQSRLVRVGMRRTLWHLDSLAVLGGSLKSAVDGIIAPERVAVVPNGTPAPRPTKASRQPALGLYLSNLRKRKGVREAMQAALIVLGKKSDCRFVFAGECRDAALEMELRELAEESNGRIELRTALRPEEKHELLAEATFLLFPPVEPEGHPRVVLEAMAAGLPVVATDQGAIAETVVDGETGFVLEEADPDQLAEKVLQLLVDQHLRERLSQGASARWRQRYTQAVADKTFADWLVEVAANRTAPKASPNAP